VDRDEERAILYSVDTPVKQIKDMTVRELAEFICKTTAPVDEGGEVELRIAARKFREAGVVSGAHVGREDLGDKPRECMEWYAGQFLSMVDANALYAVNSWINARTVFTYWKE
jgi:hypothetical protein